MPSVLYDQGLYAFVFYGFVFYALCFYDFYITPVYTLVDSPGCDFFFFAHLLFCARVFLKYFLREISIIVIVGISGQVAVHALSRA